MRSMILVLCGCGVLWGTGCGEGEQAASKAKEVGGGGNPLTAPVDYVGAVGKAKVSAEKAVDLASLTRAVEAFMAGEGAYPKTLGDLVKEGYLSKLPEAPRGYSILYDASTGSVALRRLER